MPVAAAPPRACCGSCFGFLCRLFHHGSNYRTAWVRVPTTNFRPVVTCDPITGTAMTTLQPCTTYTWEVRRVPAGGWFSAAASPESAMPTAGVSGYSTAVSGACATCPPASAVPYYTVPATTTPGLPEPAGAPLAAPVPDPAGGSTPGWSSPSGSADQAPQLTPGEAQGLQNLQRPSTTSGYPPIPLSDPSEPIQTRQSGDQRQEAGSAEPQPPRQRPAEEPRLELSPVPDPDPPQNTVPAVPSRFDPRDRTAANLFRPVAATAPIVWADGGRPAPQLRQARVEAAPPAAPLAPAVDTGVWRVIQP